jgi:hypothetical protein
MNVLDENSSWLSVWMEIIPKKLWQMEITVLIQFSCPTSSKKEGVKGETRKSYIIMQKGETITCVS